MQFLFIFSSMAVATKKSIGAQIFFSKATVIHCIFYYKCEGLSTEQGNHLTQGLRYVLIESTSVDTKRTNIRSKMAASQCN